MATSPPRRDLLPPHLRSEIHLCRRENNTSTSRNERSCNHLDPQMPPSVFEQGGLFSPLAPLHLGVLGEEIPNDPGKMFVGGLSWQVWAAETFGQHGDHSPFFQTTPESVREYFSQFGDVAEVMVMKDPATRRSRGFGFITFTQASSVGKVNHFAWFQVL